jgi:TrmH family RNA methyltransferase
VAARGTHHPDVRRLRTWLRDAAARRDAGVVVLEGPRLLDAALARGASVRSVYVGVDARAEARSAVEAAVARGIAYEELASGVAGRVADVRTTSGVLAVAARPRGTTAALDAGDVWLVAACVNDPGNLGTMIRAAEAAGATGIAIGHGSVDPYNPKVVRASAGAIFGIPVVEGDAVAMLEQLARRGVRRLGAAARDGEALDAAPLTEPVALVLGHETRGLGPLPLDGVVTIPMAGNAESLNVAMAATVLLFETARRRAVVAP